MSDGKNGFEKTKHNFPYKWTLKDAVFVLSVEAITDFTFSCVLVHSIIPPTISVINPLGANQIVAYAAFLYPILALIIPFNFSFFPLLKTARTLSTAITFFVHLCPTNLHLC